MPVFTHSDFFPVIASAIHAAWEERRDWVLRDQLVARLAQDPRVQEALKGVVPTAGRSPSWYIGNAIDWFSQKYTTDEKSPYRAEFERTKIDERWAYRPSGKAAPRPEHRIEYVKLAELGRGGFAVVYKGEMRVNGRLERLVAIKTYYGEFNQSEFNILSQLSHPNVIRLLDRYEDQDFRGNAFTSLVMEFAEEGTLASRIKAASNGIAEAEATPLLIGVASALEYLHTRPDPIVHRDVKPANILISAGASKLGDVGIAKMLETTTMTHTGIQTVAYAAPEMLPGTLYDKLVVSPKADVYSLGITSYQALTGTLPWKADNNFEFSYKHHNAPVPRHPLLSDRMWTFIDGCTAKDYHRRWSSAQALDFLRAMLANR